MESYITVKREDGTDVNPAERNIILLRYAAFLNENENGAGITIQQMHQQQPTQIQIIEQPQPTTRKSTKSTVQTAQATTAQQTNQKVGG